MHPTNHDVSRHLGKQLWALLIIALILFKCLGVLSAADPLPSPAGLPTLTNISQIQKLTAQEADLKYPVQMVCQVTFFDPEWRNLYLKDSSGVLYLGIGGTDLAILVGDYVRVKGRTGGWAGYASLFGPEIEVVHPGKLPAPKKLSLEQLLTKPLSCEWVEVQGRVRLAYRHDRRMFLHLENENRYLKVVVRLHSKVSYDALLDTKVSVQGVTAIASDKDQPQQSSVNLMVMDANQIQILERPTSPPWSAGVLPIKEAGRNLVAGKTRRVRLQGLVVQQKRKDWVLARDDTGTVRARSEQSIDLDKDDRVELCGFPELINGELVLQDTVIKRINASVAVEGPNEPLLQPSGQDLPLLTNAPAIHRLTQEEASKGYPVRLEAVVTYWDPRYSLLFIQDESGVFVNAGKKHWQLATGQRLRIEGTTAAGGFAPLVTNPKIDLLGDGRLPEPLRLPLRELVTGQYDCDWVELAGRVRSVSDRDQHLQMQIMTPEGSFLAMLPNVPTPEEQNRLLNAWVRVQGACGTIVNKDRQMLGVRLMVPNLAAIHIQELALPDPFAIATRSIRDLLSFMPRENAGRMVKISGTVIHHQLGHKLVLQDETGGIFLSSPQLTNQFAPGDRVEAVGFPMLGEFSPTLQDAAARKVGDRMVPSPIHAKAEQFFAGNYDGQWVEVEARLLERVTLAPSSTLVLQDGPVIFQAYLTRGPKTGAPPVLESGSRLRLRGVAALQAGESRQVKGFRLLVSHPDDLVVLERPSWWTGTRLLWFASTLVVISFVMMIGLATLSRKNRQLEIEIQERHRAEMALQQARDDLERQVEARTAELVQANADLRQRTGQLAQTNTDLVARTEELARTNATLSAEIEERKRVQAEMESVQQQLVETSRQAGMAEVATGVLHNVGNVLNSVNVSANLITQKIRQSRVSMLPRLSKLLRDHQSNLTEFLTHDARGKEIPEYMEKLGDHLVQEHEAALQELGWLNKNVEHIKDIVAMQQSYAQVSGVHEQVVLKDLVEDALRMHAGSFIRHDIRVVREFETLPPVLVDRHKVLQILINLFSNAKHACDDSGRAVKQVRVRIAANRNGKATIEVTDNGVGISKENLTRIFGHGFTTRKGGHGFGLHSAALAAQELGGDLRVHSEGAGLGATFTLELPLPTAAIQPAAQPVAA